MYIRKFKNWCDAAVDGIIFLPDRKQVHGELMNHLYDHYDDLVSQGVDKETAQQLALEAMGSAREIAPQLAAIHRPFWGYVYQATKILLGVVFWVQVACGILWMSHFNDYSEPRGNEAFDPYQTEISSGDHRRIFAAEPNLSAQSDGYTLTLTRAALWEYDSVDADGNSRTDDCFYFQMEVSNPRPWAEDSQIGHWFRAVDSLGNTYDCFYEGITNYAPYISGNTYHTGPYTYTHDMWISDYRSQEAEWIELYYDRSGRNIAFRVDLTGGDAP